MFLSPLELFIELDPLVPSNYLLQCKVGVNCYHMFYPHFVLGQITALAHQAICIHCSATFIPSS